MSINKKWSEMNWLEKDRIIQKWADRAGYFIFFLFIAAIGVFVLEIVIVAGITR